MRRFVVSVAIVLVAVVLMPAGALGGKGGQQGGPIVLMGLDADDGIGNHGPISVMENVIENILADVTKSGTGILVLGAGNDPAGPDCVTEWWQQVSADIGVPVTFANGTAAIGAADFTPFRLLAVTTDENEISCGPNDDGLTQAENDTLATRANDVANFVNSGGGLLGFTSNFPGGAGPYAYMGEIGAFNVRIDLDYDDIAPTPEGEAVGVTNDLDVDNWHTTFLSFPGFLDVLATHADETETDGAFGEVAAVGGEKVVFERCPGYKNAKGNHIVGTKKKDVIRGTRDRDIICGLKGNDRLLGKFGNDLILGGAGNDNILGGHGNDKLKGEDGNDLLRGMVGGDKHIGGPGADQCKGGRGNDSYRTCENKN